MAEEVSAAEPSACKIRKVLSLGVPSLVCDASGVRVASCMASLSSPIFFAIAPSEDILSVSQSMRVRSAVGKSFADSVGSCLRLS